MLSKQERLFVQCPSSYSIPAKRAYRFKINKKIKRIAKDIDLIVKNSKKTGIDISPLAVLGTHIVIADTEALPNSVTADTEALPNSVTDMSNRLQKLSNW